MMNFRIENAEYNSTESGRFYRTENGKKVRISKAEFDTAWNVYTCDKAAEMTEEELLAKIEENKNAKKQTEQQPEDELVEGRDYIEYKGYKIFGNDNIRYVATAPYGGTSPESYATVDEAKAAIDADLKSIENAKKASEKPEKTQKTDKVQKDSKKAAGTKKAKEKAPKTKKVPEGGAEFEVGTPPYSETVILTAKQIDFIRHLPDTCFWEHGLESCIWVDCLCDDIKGQFEGKPMTVGAMISTLCEKGLGLRAKNKINNRKATAFRFTEKGKLVAQALGLK